MAIAATTDEARLEALLRAAGSSYDTSALAALLAGIAAAAPRDEGWMRLIARSPSEELKEALRGLYRHATEAAGKDRDGGGDGAARLAALRAELARLGLDGFLVPLADEHQGEYIPGSARRLAWLTGFTGSAGLAAVLTDKAAIFVDGRYTLQAERQVDGTLYERRHLTEQPAPDWLAERLRGGQRLGFDPWLHTKNEAQRLRRACKQAQAELIALPSNPLDAVWAGRPPKPIAPIVPHPLDYAGKPSADKRAEIAAALARAKADAAFLSAPDSIAWLLNVRGGDVACTPLPLSFALVFADARVEWFVDRRKLTPDLKSWLGPDVALAEPEALGERLAALKGKTVRLDPGSAPYWGFERLGQAGAEIAEGDDPCALPKARKNAAELAGARAAHRRDGAALTRFLCWLERAVENGGITELSAAHRLAEFRAENDHYRGPSFETISGSGPNGAVVHYRVSAESNRAISAHDIYLVDSGGQYLDGTTDVTRTVAFRVAPAEACERFTRVLKGHIALARARFPAGTAGQQLDALARRALWEAGLDYDHGTGHGVGSYLGVHEGPQRISKTGTAVPLEPGMIVSNEPGYYRSGEYGIRIENLVVVSAAPAQEGAEKTWLAFETLTKAPIDLKLVEPQLLEREEKAWLNAYHASVRESLIPLLDPDTAAWLSHATRPVG